MAKTFTVSYTNNLGEVMHLTVPGERLERTLRRITAKAGFVINFVRG